MKSKYFAEKNSNGPYLSVVDENQARHHMENDLFETEKEDNLIGSFLTETASDPPKPKEKATPGDLEAPFLSSFLVDLIHSIKHTLVSIKNTSQLSMDKLNDVEFRKYAQKSIAEDIKQIDSVMNSLLNYIHINTPIIKSNTISFLLEEVLEANEKQIQCKKIKIFKKCEKDLPETFIHDEQVRFILNSILQHAILSTPLEGTIGFLIKSFDFQNQAHDQKTSPERNGSYIEAAIGFISSTEQNESPKDHPSKPADSREEAAKLILQLVKEILQRNHGSMTYEVDPKKPRTLITLRFPIERRKVIYYEPISI